MIKTLLHRFVVTNQAPQQMIISCKIEKGYGPFLTLTVRYEIYEPETLIM